MSAEFDEATYCRKLELYNMVHGQMGLPKEPGPCLTFTERLYDFLIDNRFGPMAEQITAVDGYACQVGDDVEKLSERVAKLEAGNVEVTLKREPYEVPIAITVDVPLMGPEYAESMEWIDPPTFVFMPYGLGVEAHKPTGENIVVKLASDDPPPCPAPVDPKRQPGRLTDKQSVVEYLEKQGGRGSVTGQIAKACWIKSGTVSARLTDLIQAGQVVQREQDGRKFYWLTAYAPPVDAAPVEPPTAQPQPQEVEPAEEPVAEEAIPTPDEALDRDILYEIRSRADMRLSSRLGQLADSLAEPEKKIQKRLSILEADGRIKQRTPGAYVLA